MICGGGFDIAVKVEKLTELAKKSSEIGFWDDTPKAQGIMRELTQLRDEVSIWEKISEKLNDTLELAQLNDPDLEEELSSEVEWLSAQVEKLEFRALFSDPYDEEPAIMAIHAGAGGTEAQDWAMMLQRMFIRWAESHDFAVEIIDQSPGDEAGIKSTLMSIDYIGDRRYVNRVRCVAN